eukprot:scaffold108113_cov33-Phaeocystis_antarctica.AAC.1
MHASTSSCSPPLVPGTISCGSKRSSAGRKRSQPRLKLASPSVTWWGLKRAPPRISPPLEVRVRVGGEGHLLERGVAALPHAVESEGRVAELLPQRGGEGLARPLLEVARHGNGCDLLATHARLPLRIDSGVGEELGE